MNPVDRRTRNPESVAPAVSPNPVTADSRIEFASKWGRMPGELWGRGAARLAVCQARTVLPNLETIHGCDTLAPQQFRSNQSRGHGVFSDAGERKSIRQAHLCHPIREHTSAARGGRIVFSTLGVQNTFLCSNGKRESRLVELGRGQHGRPAWHWVPMKRHLPPRCA